MRFVVAAGGARSAIILPHASDALAAPLPLLLGGFAAVAAAAVAGFRRAGTHSAVSQAAASAGRGAHGNRMFETRAAAHQRIRMSRARYGRNLIRTGHFINLFPFFFFFIFFFFF